MNNPATKVCYETTLRDTQEIVVSRSEQGLRTRDRVCFCRETADLGRKYSSSVVDQPRSQGGSCDRYVYMPKRLQITNEAHVSTYKSSMLVDLTNRHVYTIYLFWMPY